jgi:hypothetical protein
MQLLVTTWGSPGQTATPTERLRILKEAAQKYAEPWRSAALWLPDDKIIPADNIRYWASPVPWSSMNGRLTLAGDAAHPMQPFRGQGLNNALQDAHEYVKTIAAITTGKNGLIEGIESFGKEVFERGAKEIGISSGFGPLLHNWDTLMNTPMMKQGYGKKLVGVDGTKAPAEDIKKTAKEAEVPTNGEMSVVNGAAVVVSESKNLSIEAICAAPIASKAPQAASTAALDVGVETKKPSINGAPIITKGGFETNEFAVPDNGKVEAATAAPSVEESNFSQIEVLRRENESLKKRNTELLERLMALQDLLGSTLHLMDQPLVSDDAMTNGHKEAIPV